MIMLSRLFLGLLLLSVTIEGNYAAVAESATESITEVTYELKIGDLHSRQISEEGDSLIIGTEPSQELGSTKSEVKCTRHKDIHDYKEIARTEVYNRTSHAYKMRDSESDPIKINDIEYFIYIKKEVWSCKSEETADSKLEFFRVVNHLTGFKEIRGIKYHDGIEVSTKHYLGTGARKTAKVREVKYFIRNSTGDFSVRYVGKLVESTKGGNAIADWTSTIYPKSDAYSGNDLSRELHFSANKEQIVNKQSTTGIKLIMKYAYQKTGTESFGTKDSMAKCVQDQGIHPLPKQYNLDFVQVVKHHDKEFEAEIFPEYKSEYFIPVVQEIWLCETNEKKLFIRVVNEAIALKEVKNVTFHGGVTHLYAIKMHDNKVTIRLREVRYFDAISYAEIMYRGTVHLDKRAVIPKEYNGEILYALNDNRLFKVLISSEGYDIRVGQKWEKKVYAPYADEVECILDTELSYSEDYRMRFRLKAHTVDIRKRTTYTIESLNNDQQQKFISYIFGEVSICREVGTNDNKFLRVFNEVDVLVPVHEIELHDGIFVFDKFLDRVGKSKSVRLIEIKYLDIDSKRVVKYDGKVSIIKGSTTGSPAVFKDVNSAMKMTADDIFWKVGHFSNMNVDLVNLTSYIAEHPSYSGSMDYKDAGEFQMQLATTADGEIGTKTDTAECKLSTEGLYFVAMLLSKVGHSTVRIEYKDFKDYFRDYNKESLWICQLPNMGTTFNQIEDDRILNELLPNNYQNDIYSFTWNRGRYSSVNFVMIDDRSYLNFKMTNYFKKNDQGYNKFHKYEGHVLFDGGKETDKKSGTMLLGEDEEKITMRFDYLTREIEYKVGRDWLYTSQLNKDGVSLYIGHKWKDGFGNSSTVIDCKKDDNVDVGLFDTFYRTRVRDADDLKINGYKRSKHNQFLFEQYFQSITAEVWLCQKEEKKMLRVLNHFFIGRDNCRKVKEIFYYDGVTVLLGPNPLLPYEACTEIVEIKYLDPKDHTVLKFEGKVQLKGKNDELLSNEITARKLKRVAKLEVHYLPKKEVLKTSVDKSGVVLEIGVENEDTVYVPQLVCTENKGYLTEHYIQYKPEILINKQNAELKIIEQETMHINDIYECFTYTLSIWDCSKGDGKIEFTRVVNELKAKSDCMKIATIFYYDGVVIDKEPDLTIREIKFYKGKEKEKTIRVVGFVHLKGADTTRQPAPSATREIYYKLDTRRMHVKAIDKNGAIIEVGSPFEKTFGTKKDAVLCKRDKNHSYSAQYKTQMFSNLYGRSDQNSLIALNDEQVKQYFQLMKQELWKCWRNEEEAFLRVVNVYVGLKEISRIFHPDGVLIGTQVFPDNKKTVQIGEVKYLEPDSLLPLKYEGKVTLEAIFSQKATSLFQMPSQYKDYEIVLLHPSLVNASTVKYWSLDILVVHALRSEATDQILPGIKYQQLQAAGLQQRNTTVIEGAHGIKVEVGSKYDAEFTTKGELKCMLDEWNPTDEKRFLTKIKLHFDNEFYELDSDTILEYFDINSIEVWICVNNDNTLLRVVTKLTGVKEVYMVIRHDGVEFNSITLPNNGISVNITETKYLDTRDFKVLKYEGDLKMIKRMEKPPEESRESHVDVSNTVTAVAVQQPTQIAPPSRFNALARLGSWIKETGGDLWRGISL